MSRPRDPLEGTGGHNNVPGVAGIAFARSLQGRSGKARTRARVLAILLLVLVTGPVLWQLANLARLL